MTTASDERSLSTPQRGKSGRLSALTRLISLRPFDTDTQTGRSQERHRRIALTSLASALARGSSLVTVLVMIPMALGHLGPERYGIFATIQSFVLMLNFTDLGIGNGLLTSLARSHGGEDRAAIQLSVTNAFFMLALIAVIFGSLFMALYPLVDWAGIFNASSPLARRESGHAVGALAAVFLAGMPFGVIQKVQLAFQEGFRAACWTVIGNMLSLAGVVLAISLDAPLGWMVASFVGGPSLATMANATWDFFLRNRWLRPSMRHLKRAQMKSLFGAGLLFLTLQLATSFAYGSDNIITANLLGPEAVTQLAVAQRLFQIAPLVLTLFLAPLWPAYGEALSRGDLGWVVRSQRRSLKAALIFAVPVALLGLLFGRNLIRLWAGAVAVPSLALLSALAIASIVRSIGGAFSMFLNGMNLIRLQAILAVVFTLASILAKIAFGERFGLPGLVWGGLATEIILFQLPAGIAVHRTVRKMRLQESALRSASGST